MARGGTRIRATQKPVIVLAGEDSNDRRSMRILLEEFCPQMSGRLVETNATVRLRGASPSTLAERVNSLKGKVEARAEREKADLACVFVHEDLDATDGPRYAADRTRVQKALSRAFGTAHYVLAVEEIEAWLLLFPDALTRLVSSWKVPAKYHNRDTGTLTDPKGLMKRVVSGSVRRYRESDAPDVFATAVALGCLDRPVGTNRSWDQLRTDANECCRQHVPRQRKAK